MFSKISSLSLVLIIASGFSFSQVAPLSFQSKSQKFAKVEEGQDIILNYDFVNEGKEALLINETKVNCSCTEVKFPKEAIPPGGKGVIEVTFRTGGKIGYQERKVEVVTNKGNVYLTFKGVVRATEATKETYRESK